MECSLKVLVVDDDDAIRSMIERVLCRERYGVDIARDGGEAIEKLATNRYSAVVLDMMMPRVDGLGVLRYLDTRPANRPEVIVMSANLQLARESASSPSVSAVLPKPFNISSLVENVRTCISRRCSTSRLEAAG